jgi:hypothetical protein
MIGSPLWKASVQNQEIGVRACPLPDNLGAIDSNLTLISSVFQALTDELRRRPWQMLSANMPIFNWA